MSSASKFSTKASKVAVEPDQAQPETTVQTAWASLLTDDVTTARTDPLEGLEVFLLESVFSERECKALLTAAEGYGFGYTNYPKHYRGNLRLSAIDQSGSAFIT